MLRSGSTSTRPARSSGTPSDRAKGEAVTPAAQSTVAAETGSPPITTTPGWMEVTGEFFRTSTHSLRSDVSALAERPSGKGGKNSRPSFDQNDARIAGIDVPKVARHHLARDLADGPRQFDPCRPGAHNHKR